jgi:hypothetical protein
MGIREKIINLLTESLPVHYVRLEEDDGISGFVVSPKFQGVSTIDRQGMIEDVLSKGPSRLTGEENRQILMIAGLTPEEYESVGARIRVHKIKELAGGTIDVLLHGGHSDAEYVRGALSHLKNVRTTDPKQVPGAVGTLMSFKAKRTGSTPLTKSEVVKILNNDRYIQVMPDV